MPPAEPGDIVDAFGIKLPEWTLWAAGGVVGALILSIALNNKKKPAWSGPAEGFATLEPENECDPRLRPGTVAFRAYVLNHFGGGDDGILRECGGALSGHTAGRAWDWKITGNNDLNGFFHLLFDNNAEGFRRAGLTYVIYNRQIWNARDRVWQNYTGADPHTGHVHISFSNAGADGQTSFYRPLV